MRKSVLFIISIVFSFLIAVTGTRDVQAAAKWKVTQYAGKSGNQSMFYTITDSRGRLCIIDGGWRSDAGQVRNIIRKHKNKVHVWIITHPHPDHTGAFNSIMESGKIKVDKIYTIKVNKKLYKKTAAWYDEYEEFEAFEKICKKHKKKVTYFKENDTADLLGLKMKVFSVWDSSLKKYTHNLCNYGSLVFRVEGKKDSMLFCSDVEKKVEKKILEKHKKELYSTYVQCGHHGNWGLSKKFYKYVNAKGAFFDAPKWITEDHSGTYDAPMMIKFFKKRKTKVFLWKNAPNRVTLR